jgi:hypothetical protein
MGHATVFLFTVKRIIILSQFISFTIINNNQYMETLWKQDVARHFPGICLEGLRKTMKDLGQESWSLGLDLNTSPTKYRTEVLTTQLGHSLFNGKVNVGIIDIVIKRILHLLTQMGSVSQFPRKHVAYFSPTSWNVWSHLNLAVRPLDVTRTLPFIKTGGRHFPLLIITANT